MTAPRDNGRTHDNVEWISLKPDPAELTGGAPLITKPVACLFEHRYHVTIYMTI